MSVYSIFFLVTHAIRANCTSILHVYALPDNSIVVCGQEEFRWKLARFSMEHGKEIGSTTLKYKPDGLALVAMIFQQCLAVSYT